MGFGYLIMGFLFLDVSLPGGKRVEIVSEIFSSIYIYVWKKFGRKVGRKF
jgi:hypothetical protein